MKLFVRTGIEKSEVDEVIIGQAKQSTDSPNLARLALLRAGYPIEITRLYSTSSMWIRYSSNEQWCTTNHVWLIRYRHCWWC